MQVIYNNKKQKIHSVATTQLTVSCTHNAWKVVLRRSIPLALLYHLYHKYEATADSWLPYLSIKTGGNSSPGSIKR